MALVSEEKLQEVKDRVRLEDLARDYSVVLQSAGTRLRALCPFHREKTPSFYIHPEFQYFKCFGCGAKGDVYTFVQRMESVTFPEAIEMLARKAGIVIDFDAFSSSSGSSGAGRTGRRSEKVAIFDVLDFAEEYYHRILLNDPRAEGARRYLEARKIRPESWKAFRLGLSLPDWDGLLKAASERGFRIPLLEKAGLIRSRRDAHSGGAHAGGAGYYDYFRGRLMFPIADSMRRVVGFGARTLGDDQPKYLNTPKTPVFDKSQVLYGLAQARSAIESERSIAIVEGYTDVIVAHQEGLNHFVASLGTAFTEQNARQLRRLSSRVELIFDGDAAGQVAAERSMDLLVAEDLDVRIYTIVDGKDPCDAVLSLGGDEFRRKLREDSLGIFEFKWRLTVAALEEGRDGAADVAGATDQLIQLLLKVPNVVTRQLYAKELAERLGIREETIHARLNEKQRVSAHRERRLETRQFLRSARPDDTNHVAMPDDRFGSVLEKTSLENPSLEEVVIEILLTDPDRASQRWQELPRGFFVEPIIKSIAAEIDRQIRAGTVDVLSLMRSFVGLPEATEVLVCVLDRIEEQRQDTEGPKGVPAPTLDEKWSRCLRDAERGILEQKRKELDRRKIRAREQGDAAVLREVEQETIELLRSKGKTLSRAP